MSIPFRKLLLLSAVESAAMLASPVDAHAIIVCPAGAITRGVDVSSYQGVIDWSAVFGSGIGFGIARATDGLFVDPRFSLNWQGMQAAGLVRGAYEFFEPSQSAVTQAAQYLATVGGFGPGDLPPVLDVEVTGGQSGATIAAGITSWVTIVRGATGLNPIIYTSASFWNSLLGDPTIAGTGLWIANWGVSCPNIPSAWPSWTLWQYSTSGVVSGIGGAVDMNDFNGPVDQLLAFTGSSVTPEPASLTLMATGLVGIGMYTRRRRVS